MYSDEDAKNQTAVIPISATVDVYKRQGETPCRKQK